MPTLGDLSLPPHLATDFRYEIHARRLHFACANLAMTRSCYTETVASGCANERDWVEPTT